MFILKHKLEDYKSALPRWVNIMTEKCIVQFGQVPIDWEKLDFVSFVLAAGFRIRPVFIWVGQFFGIVVIPKSMMLVKFLCSQSEIVSKFRNFFQFEDYQQRLDHSVDRITRHLQRTRAFWESGIGTAIQNSTIQKKPKSGNDTIDEDSIDGSPRRESAWSNSGITSIKLSFNWIIKIRKNQIESAKWSNKRLENWNKLFNTFLHYVK